MLQPAKTFVFWMILLVVSVLIWAVVATKPATDATYSQFLSQVQSGEVLKATITYQGTAFPVEYLLRNGARLQTVLPHENLNDTLSAMQQKFVNIEIRQATHWWFFAWRAAPFLILLCLWFFAYSQMRRRGA